MSKSNRIRAKATRVSQSDISKERKTKKIQKLKAKDDEVALEVNELQKKIENGQALANKYLAKAIDSGYSVDQIAVKRYAHYGQLQTAQVLAGPLGALLVSGAYAISDSGKVSTNKIPGAQYKLKTPKNGSNPELRYIVPLDPRRIKTIG